MAIEVPVRKEIASFESRPATGVLRRGYPVGRTVLIVIVSLVVIAAVVYLFFF